MITLRTKKTRYCLVSCPKSSSIELVSLDTGNFNRAIGPNRCQLFPSEVFHKFSSESCQFLPGECQIENGQIDRQTLPSFPLHSFMD